MGNIPIDAILSSCKAALKIEQSDQDVWFTKLIQESIRHLDALCLFKKQVKTLDVQNNIACLPCGFFKLLALRFGAVPNCGWAVYADIPFANSLGCDCNSESIFACSNTFQIQGNKIVFNQRKNFAANGDVITSPITSCTIAYFGFDTDEDGLFNVYADMERALTAYVCWKYTQQNFREYPQYIQVGYKNEWIAQKKWIKSCAYYNDFWNKRFEINEWSSAILVDKTFGI